MNYRKSHSQAGQSVVEYAVIIALVIVGMILAVTVFGEELEAAYCGIANALGAENCSFQAEAAVPCDFQFEEGDNFDNWITAGGYGQTVEIKGGYAVFSGGQRGQMLYTHECSEEYGNNDIVIDAKEVTVEPIKGFGISTFILMFRSQGTNNGYKFVYYPPPWNLMVVYTVYEGRHILLDYGWAPGEMRSQPNDFQIRVVGNEITAYINNQFVLQGFDSKYPEGSVGIHNGSNTRTTIGSFTVKPIP